GAGVAGAAHRPTASQLIAPKSRTGARCPHAGGEAAPPTPPTSVMRSTPRRARLRVPARAASADWTEGAGGGGGAGAADAEATPAEAVVARRAQHGPLQLLRALLRDIVPEEADERRELRRRHPRPFVAVLRVECLTAELCGRGRRRLEL